MIWEINQNKLKKKILPSDNVYQEHGIVGDNVNDILKVKCEMFSISKYLINKYSIVVINI